MSCWMGCAGCPDCKDDKPMPTAKQKKLAKQQRALAAAERAVVEAALALHENDPLKLAFRLRENFNAACATLAKLRKP